MMGSSPEWTNLKAAAGAGAVAEKCSSAESGSFYPVYKADPGPSWKLLLVRKSAGLVLNMHDIVLQVILCYQV